MTNDATPEPEVHAAARLAVHQALAPRWMSVVSALAGSQAEYEEMLGSIADAVLATVSPLATPRTTPADETAIDDSKRPTIRLAREIAGWDQGDPSTTRIPHWAVNLAAHLLDKGYALAASPADADTAEQIAQAIEARRDARLRNAEGTKAHAAMTAAARIAREHAAAP